MDQPTRRKSRSRKARERTVLMNTLANLIGCAALILMVALVFNLVIAKLWQAPKMEEEVIATLHRDRPELLSPVGSTLQPVDPPLASELNAGVPGYRSNPVEPPSPAAVAPAIAPEKEESVTLGTVRPKAEPIFAGIEEIDSKRDRIAESVRAFFTAETVEAKTAWVRHPERVRPLMEDYYSRQPIPQFEWKELGWAMPIDEVGFRFGYVQALFEGAEPVSVIVEETDSGQFRIDWESSVRYGEIAWNEFLQLKPSQPKLLRLIASRVGVGPSDSYSTSEQLELTHPSESGSLIVTFNREDPSLAPLLEQLQTGEWKDVPVTLRLCFPGSSPNQASVEIAGVEGKGWLILEKNRS